MASDEPPENQTNGAAHRKAPWSHIPAVGT